MEKAVDAIVTFFGIFQKSKKKKNLSRFATLHSQKFKS